MTQNATLVIKRLSPCRFRYSLDRDANDTASEFTLILIAKVDFNSYECSNYLCEK